MVQNVADSVADRLLEDTDAYVTSVVTITEEFADTMAVYRQDTSILPDARRRIDALESDCDDHLQNVRRLVGESMPPNYTEAYLRSGELLQLYRVLDAVPNRIEQFVTELAVTSPPLDAETRACFRDMSRRIAVGVDRLSGVVSAYVEGLVTSGDTVHVAPHVDAIASNESDCDAIRDAVIATAFESGVDAEALFVRELVVGLDAVMDAIEDVGDHLLYMNSADF
ncbi:MAG: DUF47 domain-containing protein [Halorhabdus sp.]